MYKKHLIKKLQLFFADIALKQRFKVERKNKRLNNIYFNAIISSLYQKRQNTICFSTFILSDFFSFLTYFPSKTKTEKGGKLISNFPFLLSKSLKVTGLILFGLSKEL